MIALLRWVRVGALVLVGLVLFSPLIVLNGQRLGGKRFDEADEIATAFFTVGDVTQMRPLLQSEAPAERVLAQRDALLLGGALRAEVALPHSQGPNARVGFTLVSGPDGSRRPKAVAPPGGTRRAFPLTPTGAFNQLLRELQANAKLRAEVIDQREGKRGVLHLERVDGHWKVAGMQFPVDGGGEGPLLSFRHLPPAVAADDYDLLAPLSREGFEKSWPADVEINDEPAGVAADRLLKEMNLNKGWWERGDNDPRTVRCTLHLKGRSRYEAVCRVAEQAGVGLVVVQAGVGLRRGQAAGVPASVQFVSARQPAAYAGPLRVVVAAQKESPPEATGVLQLSAEYPHLPRVVRQLLQRAGPVVSDLQARGADGRDLLFAERLGATPAQPATAVRADWLVPLRGLTSDVRQVAVLAGRVGFRLPVKVTEVVRPADFIGTFTLGDVGLTLQQGPPVKAARPPTETTLSRTLSSKGPADRFLAVVAVDAGGRAVGAWWMIPTHSMPLGLPLATAALKFRLAVLERVSYPFRFENVPLAPRPPARLAELRHPGSPVPVSVKAARAGDALTVEVNNHSLKAVAEVRLLLRGFGHQGRQVFRRSVVLRDAGKKQTFYLPLDAVLHAELVAAGKEVVCPITPAPPQADRTEAEVERVAFTDGTAWSPAAR